MLWPRVRSYRCYEPVRPTYDVMTQFGRLMMLWSSSADLWCYDCGSRPLLMLWFCSKHFGCYEWISSSSWCYDPVRFWTGCYVCYVHVMIQFDAFPDVMMQFDLFPRCRAVWMLWYQFASVRSLSDVMIQFKTFWMLWSSSKRFGCYDPVFCGCYDPVQISCGCWVSVGN